MICHRIAGIQKVHAELIRLPHAQTDRALGERGRVQEKNGAPG